jgi:hypothetical protein
MINIFTQHISHFFRSGKVHPSSFIALLIINILECVYESVLNNGPYESFNGVACQTNTNNPIPQLL